MAYNSGNFSLFSQTGFTSSTQIYGQLINPQFSPPAGVQYTNVYTSYLNPQLRGVGQGAGRSFSALSISLTQQAQSKLILNAYSLFVQPPSVSSGTLTTVYSLFVANPENTGASAKEMYTAYFGGSTGIGTTTPMNTLDVLGSVVVGTYAGAIMASDNNSMLVSGAVGVGTSSPKYSLDVQGVANTLQTMAPETTLNNQMTVLSQGYTQGGNNGGLVPANFTLSTSTTLAFDTAANVNANSQGFAGGIFDGRYVYTIPFQNASTYYGQITRYDTFSSFSSSLSYSVFNTKILNSNSVGFMTANFDGRYVYFMSYRNGNVFTSQITRYDTTVSFASSLSYSIFNVSGNVAGDRGGYASSAFDGKYIYFIAEGTTNTFFGTILQYNTTSSFTSSSSYAIFDISTVNTRSKGFLGGAYDGQYVYFVPFLQNSGSSSGFFARYDTTLPFTVSTSYQVFDLSRVNASSVGFNGAIFDGRFVYLCNNNTSIFTMYDTHFPFSSSLSYSVFNLGNPNRVGGAFDGRYIYMVGLFRLNRYDTTLPFTFGTSYSSATVSSPGATGICFDGNYLYVFPGNNSSGIITQIRAYSGPPATAQSIGYSLGDFTVVGDLDLLVNTATTATSGSAAICPTQCSGFLWVNVNGTNQRVPFF